MRVPGLLLLLFVLLAVQAVFLREAFFGASQGGAQIQLMASRPVYYVAAVPAMADN